MVAIVKRLRVVLPDDPIAADWELETPVFASPDRTRPEHCDYCEPAPSGPSFMALMYAVPGVTRAHHWHHERWLERTIGGIYWSHPPSNVIAPFVAYGESLGDMVPGQSEAVRLDRLTVLCASPSHRRPSSNGTFAKRAIGWFCSSCLDEYYARLGRRPRGLVAPWRLVLRDGLPSWQYVRETVTA
jgi:hypothetical protein